MAEAVPNFLKKTLENPLINAAGLVNGPEARGVLRDTEKLAASAIGAITIGSWTLYRRLGNAAEFGEPTHHYNPQTGEMTNSLGLPNVGIEQGEGLVEEILDIAADKPVIFSVSPATSEDGAGSSVEQSVELVNRLFAAGAQTIELNVSCPNVVTDSGNRKPIMGHDLASMAELGEALWQQPDSKEFSKSLGIKLPPYLEVDELRIQQRLAEMIIDMPIAFLVASNTIPGSRPVYKGGHPILTVPGGVGGLSGPATRMEGRLQLMTWRNEISDRLPIISTLGIYTGKEMAIRQQLGAFASEMNAKLWQSLNWQKTITEVLVEYSNYVLEDEPA